MKTDFPTITPKLLNEHAEDAAEISRLTLVRLYQRGEKANGPDGSFAIVLGASKGLNNDVKSFGGAPVPLEVVVPISATPTGPLSAVINYGVRPATVIYGATLNQIKKLCDRFHISTWCLVGAGNHHLTFFNIENLRTFEFPQTLEHGFMFDPQVFLEAFGVAFSGHVNFQYVPVSYFDSLALRPYEQARKNRNTELSS